MPNTIIIERLEFRGRCGVTVEERTKPQPLAIDVELQQSAVSLNPADDLRSTIDYAVVARRLVEVGTAGECHLLETLAERLLQMLFDEFPLERAKLWLRKLHPPIDQRTTSVGVTLERTRDMQCVHHADHAPARFLIEQWPRLPRGTVLDVAAGDGRHALYLASRGYRVDAIDRDAAALERLEASARSRGYDTITTRVIDLESPAPHKPDLGKEQYDVILVFFYLYRPLFPLLHAALKPGGMLVYETFTIDHHLHYQHPKRREFCLAPNELLGLASGLRIVHYDEGSHPDHRTARANYTARLIACKPIEGFFS
ncbi:MAG: dihydroneopterin aldolase [Nitrospira sp.]|nr:dihydroneopterin aldolase [Nitrospira sp.]